jgi:hypothetical protein
VAPDGSVTPLTIIEAPPNLAANLRLQCTLWGNIVFSNAVRVQVAPFIVAMGESFEPLVAPSSDTLGSTLFPLPPISVRSHGVGSISCTLALDAVQTICPGTADDDEYGHSIYRSSTARLVGDTSVFIQLGANAVAGALSFTNVGLAAPGGCTVAMYAMCSDATGRTGSSLTLTSPYVAAASALNATGSGNVSRICYAATAPLLLDSNSTESVATPPTKLPQLNATLRMPDVELTATMGASVTCSALLLPALVTPLWQVPIASYDRQAVSNCEGTVAAKAGMLVWSINCLSAASAAWGSSFLLWRECTWQPSAERFRLRPLVVLVLPASLTWDVNMPELVAANAQISLPLMLAIPTFLGETISTVTTCSLYVINTSIASSIVQSDIWQGALVLPSVDQIQIVIRATFQATRTTQFFIKADCTLMEHAISSPTVQIRTAEVVAELQLPVPVSFIPSDASSPLPVSPPLVARISYPQLRGANVSFSDFQCAVTSDNSDVQVIAASGNGGLYSSTWVGNDGLVYFSPFLLQASFERSLSVSLTISCARATGEGPLPIHINLSMVPLQLVTCVPPSDHVPLLAALPPFILGIATQSTSPCSGAAAIVLPQISCSIVFDAAHSTMNDTSSVFLQQAVAVMDAASHLVTFDSLIVTAPQDNTYAFAAQCFVGSILIPAPIPFTVTMSGCPAGMEPADFTCARCNSDAFSFGGTGGRCTGCPPVGATFSIGFLNLMPGFYRPQGQAGVAFGPATELHPCYNAEACILNSSDLEYSCAGGYEGPLCSVCDAEGGFARFGAACRPCWAMSSSWLLVSCIIVVLLILLTRVALKPTGARSDSSIALRIAMSFLQAIGSLRVFAAGSTKAYRDIMGWTDAVSASPLSVSAFQCLVKIPYLLQYIATITLPLAAAVVVVLIFLIVVTAKAVHCRPRARCDIHQWKEAVTTWLRGNRHWSTLLFVLFLTYMPITSSSLRALDCYTPPIDGVTYLRSDMRVQCYVGQHAVARALAYSVLVAIGLGFPALLAWLLGTATATQLADDKFRSTWGFLFDGYRAPVLRPPAAVDPCKAALNIGKLDELGGFGSRNVVLPNSKLLHLDQQVQPSGTPRPTRASLIVPARIAQQWQTQSESFVWWEAIVLVRKAGVVLLAVLVTNPYLQCVGASLWFLGFLQLHLRYRPYDKSWCNQLETMSLTAALLTALISTALLQYNVTSSEAQQHEAADMTPVEWAVTLVLAIMNLGTFGILGGAWMWLQCRRGKAIIKRFSVAATLQRRSKAAFRPAVANDARAATVDSNFVSNPLKCAQHQDKAIGAAPRRTIRVQLLDDGQDVIKARKISTLEDVPADEPPAVRAVISPTLASRRSTFQGKPAGAV